MTAAADSTTVSSRPSLLRRKSTWGLLAVLLPVAFCLTFWGVTIYWTFNLHEVVAGEVYRSSQPSPAFFANVAREKNLRSILKLNSSTESSWSKSEAEAAARLGLELYAIPIGVT